MDYLKYVTVRRDYIVLPEGALTNATRLRWWQPFTVSSGLATPSLERAQWALDNILVGGSDINPSTLLDTFDDGTLLHFVDMVKMFQKMKLPFCLFLVSNVKVFLANMAICLSISIHLSISLPPSLPISLSLSVSLCLSISFSSFSLSLPLSLFSVCGTEGVSHEESWSFYPNAVRTAGFCGNPSFHLYWPNKNQDGTHNILATRELIVQPGYILQFKVSLQGLQFYPSLFHCLHTIYVHTISHYF